MKKTIVTKIDDLIEKPYSEGETVTFAFQGETFEIDLNKRNADQFRRSVSKYMQHGRKVRVHRAVEASKSHSHEQVAKVREWAREHGYTVATRGRVPQPVWDAYKQAN